MSSHLLFLGPSPVLLESCPEQSSLCLWLEMRSLRFPLAVLVVHILNGGRWSTLNCCISRVRAADLISFCCVAYPVLPGPCMKRSFSPCALLMLLCGWNLGNLWTPQPHTILSCLCDFTPASTSAPCHHRVTGVQTGLLTAALLGLASPHCLLLRQQKVKADFFPW